MKKPQLYFLLIGILLGFLVSSWLDSTENLPEASIRVDFVNSTEVMISSLQLDFGYAQGQSTLLTLRLAPGERRTLLLNHEPGAGFNVIAQYADGLKQDFCANQGEQGQRQEVILKR